MSLQSQLQKASPGRPSVVTVGTFDGVHVGHARLFEVTTGLARNIGAGSIAITFKYPPRELLKPTAPVPHLGPLSERRSLIAALGIDHVIEVDFDDQIRNTSADEFVRILMAELDMQGLVLGPGATVGRDRGGDETRMKALSDELGFELRIVPPATVNGVAARSTNIRAALSTGDMASASELLGRNFSITGIVTEGDRRGRTLGFPTANITPDPHGALPADGIYACYVTTDRGRYLAATNVGVRPTFDNGPRVIEPFLLDFEGDLYGHRISVEFIERLREEERFESVDALIEQMKNDVRDTRRVLGAARQQSGSR
ncbi:MAG: riboflavin biosynthesis protein RibF [Dehalococcoidia bacterium]|jgi:riboflavin kinase/FMN adenylyltransferase|nr:riboflavin biosynthesis protein RibF [Dehalococcoidia bacterium]